jgi:hypothetical protein
MRSAVGVNHEGHANRVHLLFNVEALLKSAGEAAAQGFSEATGGVDIGLALFIHEAVAVFTTTGIQVGQEAVEAFVVGHGFPLSGSNG